MRDRINSKNQHSSVCKVCGKRVEKKGRDLYWSHAGIRWDYIDHKAVPLEPGVIVPKEEEST